MLHKRVWPTREMAPSPPAVLIRRGRDETEAFPELRDARRDFPSWALWGAHPTDHRAPRTSHLFPPPLSFTAPFPNGFIFVDRQKNVAVQWQSADHGRRVAGPATRSAAASLRL